MSASRELGRGRSTAIPGSASSAASQQSPQSAVSLSNIDPDKAASKSSNINSPTSVKPKGASNIARNANTSTSPTVRGNTSLTPSRSLHRQSTSGGDGRSNMEFSVSIFTTVITLLAFFAALAFGIGAWVGMNYANKFATASYQLAMWGTCHDHDDIRNSSICLNVLASGIGPPLKVKRDLSKRSLDSSAQDPSSGEFGDGAAQLGREAAYCRSFSRQMNRPFRDLMFESKAAMIIHRYEELSINFTRFFESELQTSSDVDGSVLLKPTKTTESDLQKVKKMMLEWDSLDKEFKTVYENRASYVMSLQDISEFGMGWGPQYIPLTDEKLLPLFGLPPDSFHNGLSFSVLQKNLQSEVLSRSRDLEKLGPHIHQRHMTNMATAHWNMLLDHIESDFVQFWERHPIINWARFAIGLIALYSGWSYSHHALKGHVLHVLCNVATIGLFFMVIFRWRRSLTSFGTASILSFIALAGVPKLWKYRRTLIRVGRSDYGPVKGGFFVDVLIISIALIVLSYFVSLDDCQTTELLWMTPIVTTIGASVFDLLILKSSKKRWSTLAVSCMLSTFVPVLLLGSRGFFGCNHWRRSTLEDLT